MREYSNVGNRLSAAAYAAFLRYLVTHGLTAGTAWRTARQLAAEKLGDPQLSWRRVAILDALQFDVFAHYYGSMRPDFASFFVNSVAHLQHSYWRHMEPEPFAVKPSEADRVRYGEAIRFGYVAMDRLIGRFLRLADRHGAILVFQTALSQQPFLRYEGEGGQRFYRLRDVKAFLRDCGISFSDVDPTMAHQYMITFGDDAERNAARARLGAFHYEDGRKLFGHPAHETSAALYLGACAPEAAGVQSMVVDRETGRRFPAGEILYELEAIKSGCHHPIGALWVRTGEHRRHDDLVSILDIFPTVLDLLGVREAPGERRGRSLIGRLSERRSAA